MVHFLAKLVLNHFCIRNFLQTKSLSNSTTQTSFSIASIANDDNCSCPIVGTWHSNHFFFQNSFPRVAIGVNINNQQKFLVKIHMVLVGKMDFSVTKGFVQENRGEKCELLFLKNDESPVNHFCLILNRDMHFTIANFNIQSRSLS